MKLSKREIILLTFLLIIALFFVETRLIITPGINHLTELMEKNAELEGEISDINMNLTIAVSMEKRKNENLTKIRELEKPFLNSMTPDSLLVFTHEMMLKHGFIPYIYTPSKIGAATLEPNQAAVAAMSYRIKEIAAEYRSLAAKPADKPSTPPTGTNPPANKSTIVEQYAMRVSATGTYAQIKTMLDDFQALGRTIIISNINMNPYQKGLLAVIFTVEYFGLEKLEPSSTTDPLNEWKRPVQPPVTVDPYLVPVPTTVSTTAASR